MRQRLDSEELRGLILRVAQGDHKALAALYDLTSPTLYSVMLRMLHQPDAAKEALQDCYIRVWQRAETYSQAKGEPLSWLIGNARYRALDLLRANKERRSHISEEGVLEGMPSTNSSPLDNAESAESLSRLAFCMRGLSEVQRKSVLLAYYEGYSHSELASAMAAPMGTVKAWLRRGLAKLRACLLEQ